MNFTLFLCFMGLALKRRKIISLKPWTFEQVSQSCSELRIIPIKRTLIKILWNINKVSALITFFNYRSLSCANNRVQDNQCHEQSFFKQKSSSRQISLKLFNSTSLPASFRVVWADCKKLFLRRPINHWKFTFCFVSTAKLSDKFRNKFIKMSFTEIS